MDRADSRKYHLIYKTTCLVTGHWYIGMHSTNNLNDGYLGSGKRLWYCIQKYGKENHVREVVEFCSDRKSLAVREKKIVNEVMLKEKQCMNLMIGGGGDGCWDTVNTTNKNLYGNNGKLGFGGENLYGVNKQLKNTLIANGKWDQFKEKLSIAAKNRIAMNGNHLIIAANTLTAIEKRKATFVERKHQQGEKNSNFGKRNKCVSKEGVTKRIPIDEVEKYLDDGWILGIKKIKSLE